MLLGATPLWSTYQISGFELLLCIDWWMSSNAHFAPPLSAYRNVQCEGPLTKFGHCKQTVCVNYAVMIMFAKYCTGVHCKRT